MRITRRIGTPTSASAWLASISEPSIASGTTSVAPAACSFSRSRSSCVRTITGTCGAWRADVGQHLQRARHVEVGDDHRAGARQAGRHQRLQPRRVAEHHRVAGRGGLAHAVGVQVERHVGNAFALEHARQVLAAAAVAADDHVLVGVDRLARDGGHLQRLLQPLAGHQLHHDAVAVHDDEGRGQHRQHHARQHRVEQVGRHQVVAAGPASAARSRTRRPAPGTGRCAATRPWWRPAAAPAPSPAPA